MDDYRKKPHWTSDSDGEWAVCVPGDKLSPGTRITVFKADGSSHPVVVSNYLELGAYGHLYEVDTSERDRMRRADETVMLEVDKSKGKGTFVGSDGEIYTTTLSNCGCMDFKKRGQACKHMYRLSQELGADVTPIPENAGKAKKILLAIALVGLGVGIVTSELVSWIGYFVLVFSLIVIIILHKVDKEQEAQYSRYRPAPPSNLPVIDAKASEEALLSMLNTVYGGEHENKKIKVINGVAQILDSKRWIPLTDDIVESCDYAAEGDNFNVSIMFRDEKMSLLMVNSEVFDALKKHCKIESMDIEEG